MRRHREVRVWFMPWKTRCACGCAWFPCPDAVTVDPPAVTESLRIADPRWNGPTVHFVAVRPVRGNERPLMTKGQQWRSRRQ
ncbi:hypothetical protein Q0Z83_038090 [Actinoplanes sichuanensis]|uniref:Secreted protein n=1 Tax=Actinoplanes sichuanensis TaxID=512349 RepID=A0ABW4A4C8_9ACTN|nr:hypothetical protein [Actinoplanes sichuanensis]BEL05618.1 hypothetical protein Q0Z83_038090 [Actinoplanes sichuanensis]